MDITDYAWMLNAHKHLFWHRDPRSHLWFRGVGVHVEEWHVGVIAASEGSTGQGQM